MEKGKILLALVIVLMVTCLVGCGSNLPGEESIQNDLQMIFDEEYVEGRALIVDEVTIVDRKTSKEDGQDTVFFQITAHRDEVVYERQYYFQYVYYDGQKEWRLEGYDVFNTDEWTAYPTAGISDERLRAELTGDVHFPYNHTFFSDVKDGEYEILDKRVDLEKGTETIDVEFKVSEKYYDVLLDTRFYYEFDESDQEWHRKYYDTEILEEAQIDWHFEGIYQYIDRRSYAPDNSMRFKIEEIDGNKVSALVTVDAYFWEEKNLEVSGEMTTLSPGTESFALKGELTGGGYKLRLSVEPDAITAYFSEEFRDEDKHSFKGEVIKSPHQTWY